MAVRGIPFSNNLNSTLFVDPELAEYWLQLKDENLTRVENGQLEENSGLKPRPSDQQPEIFIEEIGKLTAGWSYDNTKEYLSIEQVYRRLYGYGMLSTYVHDIS